MTQYAPRRVAIADDSPEFLAAAASYIGDLPGFSLAGTARTTSQTLALIETALPDVLLLDLGLGPRRGLDFLRRIKSAPRAPAVIALTLFHTPEAAAAVVRAGADALIGKDNFVVGLRQVLGDLFPAALAA